MTARGWSTSWSARSGRPLRPSVSSRPARNRRRPPRLADHPLKAHTTGADGQALLWAGTLTVLHQDDGQWRTDSTVIIDTFGPAIDLVHPARSRDELATHGAGEGVLPASLGGPEKPSRWMAAFTREVVPC